MNATKNTIIDYSLNMSSKPLSKRASVRSLGCRLNQSEGVALEGRLRAAGYEVVEFGEDADLGVLRGRLACLRAVDGIGVAFLGATEGEGAERGQVARRTLLLFVLRHRNLAEGLLLVRLVHILQNVVEAAHGLGGAGVLLAGGGGGLVAER